METQEVVKTPIETTVRGYADLKNLGEELISFYGGAIAFFLGEKKKGFEFEFRLVGVPIILDDVWTNRNNKTKLGSNEDSLISDLEKQLYLSDKPSNVFVGGNWGGNEALYVAWRADPPNVSNVNNLMASYSYGRRAVDNSTDGSVLWLVKGDFDKFLSSGALVKRRPSLPDIEALTAKGLSLKQLGEAYTRAVFDIGIIKEY